MTSKIWREWWQDGSSSRDRRSGSLLVLYACRAPDRSRPPHCIARRERLLYALAAGSAIRSYPVSGIDMSRVLIDQPGACHTKLAFLIVVSRQEDDNLVSYAPRLLWMVLAMSVCHHLPVHDLEAISPGNSCPDVRSRVSVRGERSISLVGSLGRHRPSQM